MKKYLILLLLSPFVHAQDYQILRVIDGDTVVISAPFLPQPLKPELSLRLLGVDTPEKGSRAKCHQEDDLSNHAMSFVQDKIKNAKTYQVIIKDWDKFGGRVLGHIIVDNEDLSELLIKNHYAKSYWGQKKESWCPIN